MWQGYHGFPVFPVVFLVLFLVAMTMRLIAFRRFRRSGRWCMGGVDQRVDAELILRSRLAKGEIGEEEYLRIKETLSK